MKKIQLISIIYLISLGLFAQPTTFSWAFRHGHTGTDYSYISPAKDQVIPGPCYVFAGVAAVEAMAHIYYNKLSANPGVDLSESFLYNNSGDGMICDGLDVYDVLTYIRDEGVIDENGYGYRGECSEDEVDPDSMNYCITIPRFLSYTYKEIPDNTEVKKAILDYGPLVVTLAGYEGTYGHSILLLGWGSGTNSWHIKDSWPGDPAIEYVTLDLFNHSPIFYTVVPLYNNEKIEAVEGECPYLSMGTPVDLDLDGLYNWGFHATKPDGWSGISLMDFDDYDPNKGFM